MKATRAKRWGNSLAVIIPKEVVAEKHLHAGDEVLIEIEAARSPQRATWGLGKGKSRKSIQELVDEDREDA